MNIMVYQIERRSDGTMALEPLALYSRLGEARNRISQLMRKGKEACGMSISPFRVSMI